jgi:hypothetical protein
MEITENSRRSKRSAKLPGSLGRPRTRPVGESTILSLKVEDELIRLLDAEAKTMSAEQPPGRASVSRGELVRIALHEWLAARAKARAERSKPRQ